MASLDLPTCRARLAAARVARLATVTNTGLPHVVPCCFVLDSSSAEADRIYSVVDGKPKSTAALKRLENVLSTPAASLVADHYADDWAELWWVRADGVATIVDQVESAAERNAALDALAAKYDQYRTDRPEGALLRIDVDRLTGWSFSEA
ncbi:MAG: TIGR03668 family PPOX class F420-dependent oxidoreductase [Acidimicrobiales bacterium]